MGDRGESKPEFWLFGYGSLIWKPPPHYDRRVPGYIDGYVRRFWQASQDHRGTPDAPGRVVTLIERSFWETLGDHHAADEEHVWGAAYRIIPSKVEEVQAYLDIREINGYSIQYTDFQPADSSPTIRCMVYIGLPNQSQFTGVQEPQALAEHIWRSRGPSGENTEYLFMLEQSLDQLSKESGDAHVRDLAGRVRALEDSRSQKRPGEERNTGTLFAEKAVETELKRTLSGESKDEQEEVER